MVLGLPVHGLRVNGGVDTYRPDELRDLGCGRRVWARRDKKRVRREGS